MAEYKKRAVYYKQAVIGPTKSTQTLSQVLHAALMRRATIGKRRQSLGESEETSDWLVIGEYRGTAHAISCALMRYSPGTAAAALIDDLNAQQVQLSAVHAPTAGGLRREFIDGMLLFTVAGNHVAMMQSVSVRERTLESHLYWLLQTANVLAAGQAVSLHDQPTAAARQLAATSPVRRVELIGALATQTGSTSRVGGNSQQAAVSRVTWQAFRALFAGEADLPLQQLDASQVSFNVQLRYEGRRHETANAALDKIATAVRHADGVDVRIELDNGSVIENEQLRTSGKIDVLMQDGVPDIGSAFGAMQTWLRERLDQ